jgi:fructose-1,6-bisphosphatase/inositol monophosphatase family enzyme
MTYFSAGEMKAFRQLEAQTSTTLMNHDGYAFGMLADGSIDIALEVQLKPYDFCALVPVVEQAGGVITDWDGQELTIHSDGRVLAARSPLLHEEALKVLQQV